tara:strand:- start:7889 stop:9082 length:1194 start_codon:yes stop_codon:yes gene_type:complete
MTKNNEIKQAVIFCGGKGSRLGKLTKHNPKPLLTVNHKPFLYHLIKKLEGQKVKNVILLTGYLDKKFELFKKKYESEFHLTLSNKYLPEEYETALRLKNVLNELDDQFYILYGDNYWDGNFQKHNNMIDNFYLVTTLYDTLGHEDGNFKLDKNLKVIEHSQKKVKNFNHLEMGYMIAKKEPLSIFFESFNKNVKFSDAVFNEFRKDNQLGVVTTTIRHKSIGTEEGLKNTRKYFKSKKIIFLDRDGVLNNKPKKADYVKSVDEFIWKPGSREALQYLSKKGYKIIIISNQPGISRGKMSLKNLQEINKKIIKDLKEYDSKIYDFFYCLHNWNDGCDCRKPKPGLLIQAQDKYNLKLSDHYFIGDDQRDIEAGENSFTKTVKLSNNETLIDKLLKLDL